MMSLQALHARVSTGSHNICGGAATQSSYTPIQLLGRLLVFLYTHSAVSSSFRTAALSADVSDLHKV